MDGWKALSRLAPGVIPRAIILLYHRVADPVYDPQLLCVSPENFAGQMEVLRSLYRPCALGTVTESWCPQPASVVVTFDDGYADNLLNARPILRQKNVPATVFVSTGFIGNGEKPYWDELTDLFLRRDSLPPRLALAVHGVAKSWDFGAEPPVTPTWNVLQESTLARQDAYSFLCNALRLSGSAEREKLLTEIRDWSGRAENSPGDRRFMNAAELTMLADDDLVEIGAHTVSHPNLARLCAEEQRSEIAGGRERLEKICGRPLRSFAYPYGTRENYTPDTVSIVKEEGFTCACSNFDGIVWPGADRHQLPRVLVRNWSAVEFAERLSGYFR